MKKTKTFILIVFVALSVLNLTAQEFKFQKKLNKYVFKSENGKLDESKAFDHVDYNGSLGWYVKNDELWGIVNKKGEFVLPIIFQQIDFFSDKKNLVKLNGIWGEYTADQFTPIEGEIVFNKPQELPFLSKCKEVNHDQCLIDEIYSNIRYPKEAVSLKIEGTMIAELIINEKGQVESSTIIRKIGGGCDEEFMRLIGSNLNQWEPGKIDGKPVKTRKFIPIKMSLK